MIVILIFIIACWGAEYRISEEKLLRTAYEFMMKGEYKHASFHLKNFIKKYPKSKKIAEAHYSYAICLGETPEAVRYWRGILANFYRSKLLPDILFRLGRVYYRLGKYKEARSTFNILLKKFPSHFLGEYSLYEIGLCYLANGEFDSAEESFNNLIEKNPYYEKYQPLRYALGLTYYFKKEYGKALKKFEGMDTPSAFYYYAKCLQKLKQFIPATLAYKEFLKKYPNNSLAERVKFLIGTCFYQAGDYNAALSEYKEFIVNFPKSKLKAHALYKVGCCYFWLENYPQARTIFEKIVREFQMTDFASLAQYLISESFFNEKDISSAIDEYNKLITRYEGSKASPYGYFKLGWCYNQQRNYRASIKHLSYLLENYTSHELFPLALFLIANSYSKIHVYEDAITNYKQVTEILPQTDILVEAAIFGIIKICYKQKNYGEIVTTCRYIFDRFPRSNSIWSGGSRLLIGESLYQLGLYSEAQKMYEFLIENYKKTDLAMHALDGKAWCHFEKGEYQLAEKARKELMSEIMEAGKKVSKAINKFEMGKILFSQKKYLKAIDYFEEFVEENPKNPHVPEALYYTGKCYYGLEYYSDAIKSWKKLFENYKDHELALKASDKIADTYFRAQKYEESIKAYNSIIESFPETPQAKEATLKIAQSYYNSGKYKEAVLKFQDFISKYPKDELVEDAMEGLILASFQLSELEGTSASLKLLREFSKKIKDPSLAAKLAYHIAIQFYEKKNYTMAAEEFRIVINEYGGKNIDKAYFYLAECYYNDGKYKDAIQTYDQFIQNFPNHEFESLAYLHCANSFYHLSEYEKAIERYKKLTEKLDVEKDIIVTAFLNLALCYNKQEKYEDANAVYLQFINNYPQHEMVNDITLKLAQNYGKLKKYTDSIKIYQSFLKKLKPDDPLRIEIQYRIGENYLKMEKNTEARREWEKLKDMKPFNDPWRLTGLTKLAREYEEIGKYKNAIEIYKDLLQNLEKEEWIEAIKSRISSLEEILKEGK